jgi:hypothetical protein
MTPDQKRLAIWAGAGAAIIAAGWIALMVRDGANIGGEADKLHATYLKLYHPEKPGGFAIGQAQDELRSISKGQAEETASAEAALAPALPAAYLVETLGEAAAQVTADHAALRQRSARTRIQLPSVLPFEGGLDADQKGRSRQLASLALIRLSVQACMDAGVTRIASITPGQATLSPSGEFAVFSCDLDVEADWGANARLIASLAQADGRGLGMRQLELVNQPDRTQRLRLSTTLTTLNREDWGIATGPAGTAPAAGQSPASGEGGRLRRLGGARP